MASNKQRLKARGPIQANGTGEEMPTIAWEEMSILDTLDMAKKSDEASYLNVLAQKMVQGRMTDEDWELFEKLRSPEYQAETVEEQAKDMAKYVIDVPRSWFKKSAPDKLDFNDPETFKMLQPKRFLRLHQLLLMSDVQSDIASGN